MVKIPPCRVTMGRSRSARRAAYCCARYYEDRQPVTPNQTNPEGRASRASDCPLVRIIPRGQVCRPRFPIATTSAFGFPDMTAQMWSPIRSFACRIGSSAR